MATKGIRGRKADQYLAGETKDNLVPVSESSPLSPEQLEIATTYLENDMSISETADALDLEIADVHNVVCTAVVRKYIDTLFLEAGYRNPSKLFGIMEEIIESKLEEARESELFSKKDLVDIILAYHKMRQDHLKESEPKGSGKAGTVVNQQNNFGDNWSSLIDRLTKVGE